MYNAGIRPIPHWIIENLVSFLRILVENSNDVGTESSGSVDSVKKKINLPDNSRTGYSESGEVSLRSARHLGGLIDLCWNREVRENVHISYALGTFKIWLNFSRTYLHGTLRAWTITKEQKGKPYVTN